MKQIIYNIASCMLIFMFISIMGCGQKIEFEEGFDYTFTSDPIMFGVRSDTDTFDKDNITFDIYYGVHDIGYDEKYNKDPKLTYQKNGNENVIFGMYICDSEHRLDITNDVEVSDYKTIDNYYFVKKISEEEAFSGKYGFTMSYWKGITYNHSETITIPSEFFNDEKGSFVIKLIAFLEPTVERDNYYTTRTRYIEFKYQVIDENTVRIVF